MEIFLCVILLLVLIAINGYFAMAEMAMVNSRKSRLQQLADEGSKKAELTIQISEDMDKLFATIQVAITLVGFGASAVAATTFTAPLNAWIADFNIAWLSVISTALSIIIVTILISYVTLVLGELVPKRIAMANSENVAMNVAPTLKVVEAIGKPIVFLLSASTNVIARIFRIKQAPDQGKVSEEEIKHLVGEQDSLLDEEKRMINEIFDLGDTVAYEVMVPRVDVIFAEDTDSIKQVLDRMRGTGLSRLPVYHDNYDRVVGVVMIKDLISPMVDGKADEPVSDYMREPVFVPETKDILPLLNEMQSEHNRLVIVVDEYGGTAGLITIEDIVEEVVGEIADEYDPDRKYITQLSDDEWVIDGRLPIDDASEVGFPVVESEDYETIAGWLMDTLDLIPRSGERFDIDGYEFFVQSMRRHRISLLRIKKLPVLEEPEEAEEEA